MPQNVFTGIVQMQQTKVLICTNRTIDVYKQVPNLNRSGRRWPRKNVGLIGMLLTDTYHLQR